MQVEILEKYPDLNIQVYAVWFNVLPSDQRSAWDRDLMTDARVRHFWDEERALGNWYVDYIPFNHGPIAWDIYYLYGEEAVWDEGPEPLLSSGYTVFGTRHSLAEDIMGLTR